MVELTMIKLWRLLKLLSQRLLFWSSAYAREIDFKKFREIADEVGALLFADVAT